jgi:hypothetical protein
MCCLWRGMSPASQTSKPRFRTKRVPSQFPVLGVDASAQNIWNLRVDDGRFFNDKDTLSHSHVAVVGSEAKEKLFSGKPAIGEPHSHQRS